jgi:UPF0755 protein
VKKIAFLTTFLLTAALALFLASSWLMWELNRPYKSPGEPKYFTVQKGERTGPILDRLSAEGIVKKRFYLKMAYAITFPHPKLKAGVYLFDKPLSPMEVLRKLKKGEGILLKVTLREGLTIEESAKELSAVLGTEENYLEVMNNPELIRDLDPEANNLEGYVFPETYIFAPFTPEKSVVKTIVDSFKDWWEKTGKGGSGRSIRNTMILASIVEKESAFEPERPTIAGVFINRLKLGMPLQSDPTVIYALQRRGLYTGRIMKDDLGFSDPFNTYVNKDLPPAPICSPGKSAIISVLQPERHRYLYFVARGNDRGEHQFSVTLDQHNQAVADYRKNGKH